MQKKHTQKIIAAVVLLLLVVALVVAVGKTASPAPVSSAVPSEEASSSDVEDSASSEETAFSEAGLPADSTVPEENAASEETSESEAELEENSASGSGSTAASRETAASSAYSQAASSSHTAASSSAASSSAASSIIESIESLGDAQIDSYVNQIKDLQKRSQRALYQTMRAAYDEYMQYPEEKRSLTLKVSIVLGKTAELTTTQSQCDKEFKAVIKELRQYLRDNGYDQSIADTAEAEYKAKKDAMTKELTDLTYSQVTGSGDGAHWLDDHYDEMMGD